MLTPPQLAWRAAGMPHPIDKFTISQHKGTCSTCGHAINGDAVIISSFDNKAFSAHAESFRFGGTHVCMACGWLYGAGPSKPGNFIATPAKYELAVISLESVVEGKRPWLEILRELASMPLDTIVTGVLTTDVKPRLWPRARLCSVGNFGMYVHCPDYDVSQYIDFCLRDLLAIIEIMLKPLHAGFSKSSIYYGLMRDYQRFAKSPDETLRWECKLKEFRSNPAFLPALLVSGVTKEQKKDVKSIASTSPISNTEQTATGSDYFSENQLGLF